MFGYFYNKSFTKQELIGYGRTALGLKNKEFHLFTSKLGVDSNHLVFAGLFVVLWFIKSIQLWIQLNVCYSAFDFIFTDYLRKKVVVS